MSQILVVNHDKSELSTVLNVLTAAGYEASGASSFEEAASLLARGTPDLVIADERLGEFNGLHVIVKARAEDPHVGAIVTTAVKNRGLEADAKGLNVECLVKPHDPIEWLEPVSKTLNTPRSGDGSPLYFDDDNRPTVSH
jgi:DNA-binding NtrC family response regulator